MTPEPPRPSTGPRLYLDSADPAHWSQWLPTGLCHGVTTNPVLLARAGTPCTIARLRELAHEALTYEIEEIHLQAWGEAAAELSARGHELSAIDPRVVVKLPLTAPGLTAARLLRGGGIPVTLTALFHPRQIVAAAAAGAAYAAPYLGRITDAGRDGMAAVARMHEILARTGSPTRLLVASLRSADQVAALAGLGCDTFTCGPAIVAELLTEELTSAAAADFERAAAAQPRPERA
jgi:transaldolase